MEPAEFIRRLAALADLPIIPSAYELWLANKALLHDAHVDAWDDHLDELRYEDQ